MTSSSGRKPPGWRESGSAPSRTGSMWRSLDGLPLALELAATRARSLSPQEIADRLGAPAAWRSFVECAGRSASTGTAASQKLRSSVISPTASRHCISATPYGVRHEVDDQLGEDDVEQPRLEGKRLGARTPTSAPGTRWRQATAYDSEGSTAVTRSAPKRRRPAPEQGRPGRSRRRGHAARW